MAILSFPDDIQPSQCTWRLVTRTKVFSNPFTGARQTMGMKGAYWEASLTFNNLSQDKARSLAAIVHKLSGPSGRIAIWDHAFPKPRHAVTGTPKVSGANQLGNRIRVKGCAPNKVFLSAGDYAQIGTQLVVLTELAKADSSGYCTLHFEADLRQAPADNTPIITSKPKAIMMLKDDKQAGRRSSKKLVLSSMSFTLIEDVTA